VGGQSRRLKHWGWGYEDEQLSGEELRGAAGFLAGHLGFGSADPEVPMPLESVSLPAPRLRAPDSLTAICSSDLYQRALHTYGSSYRDVVRAFRGEFEHPPDVVAHPRTEDEVVSVLDWAMGSGAAVIPFGGGTSVVGGVEPVVDSHRYTGVVTIDLKALDQVREVDSISHSARIQGGATGPELETQLRAHGLTLRHFPQSFQFATLGGMIATRAGGHFATLDTHIDDLVESVRAVTPIGIWESRRLPGSGAGISPDRMLIGSEGTLGIITEAWVRVRPRPRFRASAAVRFGDFMAGAEAVRALSQSGLHPANCRLIDPSEAALTGAGDGSAALLVLGFESSEWDVEALMARALECCGDHGGDWAPPAESSGSTGQDSVGTWREAFVRAPTCVTPSWPWACSLRPLRPRSPGTASPPCTRPLWSARWRRSARRAAPARSPAASRTCIPTAPPCTTRFSRPPSAAPRSSSGP